MGEADEATWSLGWMKRDEESREMMITVVRSLGSDEYAVFSAAQDRLAQANFPAMFSVLALAFDSMRAVFTKQVEHSPANRAEPATRYLMQYHFTAALAAFSYFRANMGRMVDELDLPELSRVKGAFAAAYANDRHWRLLWQLRNIDQHQPPALRHISLRADAGQDGANPTYEYVVDVDGLISHAREVIKERRHLRQWDDLEAMWVGHPREVSLARTIDEAMEVNDRITTDLLLAMEDQLRDDIWAYLTLAKEVDGEGAAIVIRHSNHENLRLEHFAIDPRAAGVVAESINKARKVKGRPPRFDVSMAPGAFSISEVAAARAV